MCCHIQDMCDALQECLSSFPTAESFQLEPEQIKAWESHFASHDALAI